MKVPFIVLVLALAGGGYWWFDQGAAEADAGSVIPRDGLFEVRRGDMNVVVTENGSLVAKESRKIDSNLRGEAKITFLVEEGATIKEGDVVVELDATSAEDQLEQRELDVVQATADLESARTELAIQIADNERTIEKAKIAVEKAVKELERYIEGDAPKERRKFEIAINDADIDLAKRTKVYNDSKKLIEKDYITLTQLDEDRIAFERSKVQLEGAKEDLGLFNDYTFPMTQTDRMVAVDDAKAELATAEMRAKSQLRQREVNVEQYETRLSKLQKHVADLEEEISKMTIYAPSPGIVIYGDPRRRWWRQDEIRVGAQIWGNTTLMTIPDLRIMQARLRIHEADISKLDEGQTAKITMDTYPGLVLDGTVTKIATIADDEDEVKLFDVEVTLESSEDVDLRPGISAKAEIFIERREDVLHVPLQCVFLEEARHWTYVLGDSGAPERVEVVPGTSNENYVEILEGLEEGQLVLLYNPRLGDEASADSGDETDADAGADASTDEAASGSGDDAATPAGGEDGSRKGKGKGGMGGGPGGARPS